MSFRFLVVDDNPTMLHIVEDSLNILGHSEVIKTRNGYEALGKIIEMDFDFIITDLDMPKMDGIAFVKKIRQKDKKIPILVVSNETKKERIIEAMKAGVNNYIVKPITTQRLKQEISKFMG